MLNITYKLYWIMLLFVYTTTHKRVVILTSRYFIYIKLKCYCSKPNFSCSSIIFRTAVLRKLFEIRFSYKHCNFSRVCPLVKMASKIVTRSIWTGFWLWRKKTVFMQSQFPNWRGLKPLILVNILKWQTSQILNFLK